MPYSIDNAENLESADRLLDSEVSRFEAPDKMSANTDFSNTDLLLMRICKLLEVRLRSADKQRENATMEKEAKNDWVLAAAVIDRFLFLTFGFLFIAGTFMFFLAFSLSP